MLKSFLFIACLFLLLNARENPFFSSNKDLDIPITSNQKIDIAPLKRATFTLPSNARTIESITIEYKNLDGSLSRKKEILQNSIDWHLPLFLSQNYGQSLNQNQAIIENKIKYVNLLSLKFIKIYERKKALKLLTKDTMIRNFLLTQPHRIVCDFKRDIEMRSYEKKVTSKSIVKMLRVGNHDGFYRVVIELDGYYSYKVEPIKGGYLFNFL